MSETRVDTDNKQEAEHHEMEQLRKVNSKDSLHRNELGHDATDLEQNYWSSPRLIGSIAATFFLANSIFIGYAMPVNVLTVINADIGPSPNIYLISLVNTLFTGVLHLFFAHLSDILGRRYFLIGGQMFGVIGSIVCATSSNINTLIGGSVMTGIGGASGLLYPIIVHELIPNKYRPWGQAVITLAVLPTLGFGTAIARTLVTQPVGWRGVYWLNVAVSGASVVLFAACYFPPSFHLINGELTKWKELKSLDYGGVLLYFAGLILVLLGFTWAQGTYPWHSTRVIAPLVIGAITLIAFGIYETYVPLEQPLLPVRLFKVRNIVACIVVGSTMQMVWLALNIFWPIQVNVLFTTNQLTIGLMSCTTGVALVAGELLFAPLFRTIGNLKWQMVIAGLMTAAFCTGMAAVTYDKKALAIAFTVVAGLANGWIEMVTLVIVGLVAPPNDIGVAQGFFASTRLTFGTVAVSIFLAIYSSRLIAFLPQEIAPAVEAAGLPASSLPDLFTAIANGTQAALEAVPGVDSAVLAALALGTKNAYTHAFKIVYLVTLAFTGIGLVAAFFIKDVDAYLTNYVNKTLHRPTLTNTEKAKVREPGIA